MLDHEAFQTLRLLHGYCIANTKTNFKIINELFNDCQKVNLVLELEYTCIKCEKKSKQFCNSISFLYGFLPICKKCLKKKGTKAKNNCDKIE